MEIMEKTRKLSVENAKWHLENFTDIYLKEDSCDVNKEEVCDKCMFDNSNIYECCIYVNIKKYSEKHNCTPEESYKKWRNILKKIVEKGE